MLKLIKYLPKVLLLFRDVSEEVKREKGVDKPFYLRQRFWGLVAAGVAIGLMAFGGVEVSETGQDELGTDLYSAALGIYGLAMFAKGAVDAFKRESK